MRDVRHLLAETLDSDVTVDGLTVHVWIGGTLFRRLHHFGIISEEVTRMVRNERQRLEARGLGLAPGSQLVFVEGEWPGDIGIDDLL